MVQGVASSLPRFRVFVVQLSSDADPDQGRLIGRVEHVESGRSTRFASGGEMKDFFGSVIRELEEPSNTDDTGKLAENHERRSR